MATRLERFDAKFEVDPDSGCWIWHAAKDGRGYGLFRIGPSGITRAHIYAYEMKYGPVPAGLQLDHFRCDSPSCCNPDHVRPVTSRENTLRSNNACARNLAKTHCPQGHPYSGNNVWGVAQGYRRCKTCTGDRQRRYRAAKRLSA